MINDICSKIVSPPKLKYSDYDLGSSILTHGKRKDFIVYNRQTFKMNCSFYEPFELSQQKLCVLYLHSMNGSRLQGTLYADFILKMGISFCTFDFPGCGNSQGSKITFGANEKYDVEKVINKLKSQFSQGRFILWGRSMGSVCAIKYCEHIIDCQKTANQEVPNSAVSSETTSHQIIGLILDSIFKSFSKLVIEIGSNRSDIPAFLVKAGLYLIKSSIEQKGKFKIKDLELLQQKEQYKQNIKTCSKFSTVSNSSQLNYPQNFSTMESPIHKIAQGFRSDTDSNSGANPYKKSAHKPFLNKKMHNIGQLPILFLASKQDKTVSHQHSLDLYMSYLSCKKQLKYFKGQHNESRGDDYLFHIENFLQSVLSSNGTDLDFEGEHNQMMRFERQMTNHFENQADGRKETNCNCAIFPPTSKKTTIVNSLSPFSRLSALSSMSALMPKGCKSRVLIQDSTGNQEPSGHRVMKTSQSASNLLVQRETLKNSYKVISTQESARDRNPARSKIQKQLSQRSDEGRGTFSSNSIKNTLILNPHYDLKIQAQLNSYQLKNDVLPQPHQSYFQSHTSRPAARHMTSINSTILPLGASKDISSSSQQLHKQLAALSQWHNQQNKQYGSTHRRNC